MDIVTTKKQRFLPMAKARVFTFEEIFDERRI